MNSDPSFGQLFIRCFARAPHPRLRPRPGWQHPRRFLCWWLVFMQLGGAARCFVSGSDEGSLPGQVSSRASTIALGSWARSGGPVWRPGLFRPAGRCRRTSSRILAEPAHRTRARGRARCATVPEIWSTRRGRPSSTRSRTTPAAGTARPCGCRAKGSWLPTGPARAGPSTLPTDSATPPTAGSRSACIRDG